jgi:hypothetical protein
MSTECVVIEAPDDAQIPTDANGASNGAGASNSSDLHSTYYTDGSGDSSNVAASAGPTSPSFLAQCLLRGAYLELHGGWHIEARLSPDHMDHMDGSAGSAQPMQSQGPYERASSSAPDEDSDDGESAAAGLALGQHASGSVAAAAAAAAPRPDSGTGAKATSRAASAIHEHDGVHVLSVGSFLQGLEANGGAAEVVIVLPQGSVVSHPVTVRGPSRRHL